MEELMELRGRIERGEYDKALELVAEMEEMSRDDKINKILSFTEILLAQFIKQAVEKRTTRSWDVSIWNSCNQVQRVNRRRKAGGTYLSDNELAGIIAEAFPAALRRASLETLEGRHTESELLAMLDPDIVQRRAFDELQRFERASEAV